MAEKFAGFPGPEVVHSCWMAEKFPLGTSEMRLMGKNIESGRHWRCVAEAEGWLHQKGHSEGQDSKVTKQLCSLDKQLGWSSTSFPSPLNRLCSRNNIHTRKRSPPSSCRVPLMHGLVSYSLSGGAYRVCSVRAETEGWIWSRRAIM